MVMQNTPVFHESWYRVANQKISLRANVKVHRQFYRGEKWYVLFNPMTNQYFRVRPGAWNFLVRLSLKKSVGDVWHDILEQDPDHAPGQGEIIDTLSQLYRSNLLHYATPEDSQNLFERFKDRKQRQIRMTLMNLLFLRIPLFDPEPLLKRLHFLIRLVVNLPVLLIWSALGVYSGKLLLDNWDTLLAGASGFLAPENIPLLYLGIVILKVIHEFGHAFMVKRFGGEVHTMGIMFMLLVPLPYVDASASWSFRNKQSRILVASGGMLFEFFVAFIAMIVWSNVGGGPIKALSYNMMIMASVTTLLFNINPLMRFDGYYILSDLLDIPNMHQQSREVLKFLLEKYAFGKKEATSPATSSSELIILAVFGVLSTAYRFVIFSGILFAISQQYLILAAFMAVSVGVSWLVVPVVKFVKYVFYAPELRMVRRRAVSITLSILGILVILLGYLPVSSGFTAEGIVESKKWNLLTNDVSGKVDSVLASSGSIVQKNEVIIVLRNTELEHDFEKVNASLAQNRSEYQKAMEHAPEDMLPISKKISALQEKKEKLAADIQKLQIRAEQSGIWVSPEAENLQGKWVNRGDSLGMVLDTSGWTFLSVITQDEASRLFEEKSYPPMIRLRGQAFFPIRYRDIHAIPAEQQLLPSAALGWAGGGSIEVHTGQNSLQTAEPFYLVSGRIEKPNAKVSLFHGQRGKVRFKFAPQPLFFQAWRKVRQLFQEYYRI